MPDEQSNVAETLPGRPRRRLLTGPTVLLFALALGVGGFLIGVQVQKDNASGSTPPGVGLGGGGRALRALLAGGGAGPPVGGGATVGQVASVDGSTLYVTTAQGGTVAVHTTPSSQVTRTVDASAHDVHPGEQVLIQGAKASDGSIQAATLASNATAAGALGGLSALGGGGGGSASGGGAGRAGRGGGGGGGG